MQSKHNNLKTVALTSLVTWHEERSAHQLCSWPPCAVFCAGPINSGTKCPEPDSTSSVLFRPVRYQSAATTCGRRLLDEVPKDYSPFTEHDVSKCWCIAEASDLESGGLTLGQCTDILTGLASWLCAVHIGIYRGDT